MRISDWSSDVCSSDLVTCSRLAEASVGCLLFLNGRHLTGVAVKREVEGNLVAGLHAVEQFGFRLECHCHRGPVGFRSEEHTSELQSLMRISYAVFCLKKKNQSMTINTTLGP